MREEKTKKFFLHEVLSVVTVNPSQRPTNSF